MPKCGIMRLQPAGWNRFFDRSSWSNGAKVGSWTVCNKHRVCEVNFVAFVAKSVWCPGLARTTAFCTGRRRQYASRYRECDETQLSSQAKRWNACCAHTSWFFSPSTQERVFSRFVFPLRTLHLVQVKDVILFFRSLETFQKGNC